MKQARLQRLLTIVDKALTLEAGERVRYLNDACGQDTILREEVEELLGSVGKSENFWEEWKEWNEKQIAVLFQDMDEKDQDLTDRQFGHYHLVERLGAGGMGVVYRARDTRLKRDVAIKFLPPGWGLDERAKARFLHEARTAASLDHTNICTIYEVNETGEGTLYIVMAFYKGETLRARLENGPVGIDEALDLALQTARGLAAAHTRGLVHRDIKPANLMITNGGTLKVLDFGIAKAEDMTLTLPGQRVGTAAYMAPEQAQGKAVDGRADLWSLGAVFYELLTGIQPRMLGDQAGRRVPPPSGMREDIPAGIDKLVMGMLEERPDKRPEQAEHVIAVLERRLGQIERNEPDAPKLTHSIQSLIKKTRAAIAALVLVILISATVFAWWWIHDNRIRWAREEAIPQIEQLADDNRIVEAFLLAEEAARLAPEDPVLHELVNRLSVPVDINSDPPGVEVSFQDYRTTEDAFHTVGRTPLEAVRVPVPLRVLRWRVEREGYDTLEAAETSIWGALDFDLTPAGEAPPRMHRVPAGSERFQANEPIDVPAFWLDTYEVTNREFQEFVDAGGYEEPRYWTRAMNAAGDDISWEELTARLHDTTGRAGPAGWQVGRYPEGTGDHPVGGVSWFEAAAYAEFVGKSLPTAYHWRRAVPWSPFGDMLLLGRFQADGSVPVGSSRAVGRYGHHDLAGNVAEWCWNEASDGKRYLLGGSWAEPSYIFMAHPARSPFERGPDFGIRLASFDAPPPAELSEPVSIEPHDFSQEVPASDEVFAVYRSLFTYDPMPLDSQVESVDDSPRHWRRETVSFKAAYGGERVLAHLFLPRDVSPPYKTVVYIPGAAAYFVRSIDDAPDPVPFLPRSGRALVFPAYKGMLERGGGEGSWYERPPRERRDQMIQSVNDLQRTIDYLETREDIDSGSLAYLGLSYGGEFGPVYTAIEQRFVTLVYLAGGFDDFELPDEIQPWHYAPRVTTPTLMVNGRDDYFSPVEAAQKPMFDAIGVAPEHKRHVILEGGHIPYNMNAVIRETLDWLDRYQGSPAPASTAEAEAVSSHSLAVLPFANTSPDAENEYFADGVTDDILTHLAQVPDFSVISRTTTIGYKGSGKSIPEIAEELDVKYVLEGSVRRAGDQVRITARLLEAGTDQTLWSERYDRKLEDIFAVQTDIAGAIAGALEVELSGDVVSRMERPPTEDLGAYDLFLVARENFYRYDAEGNGRAIELFKQALERDQDFTQARAWLSLTYAHHDLIFGMGRAWADSALSEARRAIAAQPDLPDAYGALGDAYLAIGQYTDAVAAYEQALELNPNDWHAAVSLGAAYEGQNRWDEAVRLSRRSLELNPVRSHIAYANLTLYYANLGLYEQAEAALRRALAVDPDIPDIIFSGGYLDLLNHRREAALEAAERLAEIGAGNSIAALYAAQLFIWSGEIERAKVVSEIAYRRSPTASRAYIAGILYGYTLDKTGEFENSGIVLDEMERYIHEQIETGGAGIREFRHSLFHHSLAVIHALRGEYDEAFLWLNEAVRSGWNHAAVLPGSDPLLENLQDDPRFRTALDRMQRDLTAMRERVEREGW